MSTPYMSLTLPTVSTTAGPAYATQVNAAMTTIDLHDHTPGYGQQIPASGLNINGTLPFGSNDATALRTVRFTAQSSTLTLPADLGCIYDVAGDLYWNNGSGTAVQITSGASLSASSLAGFSGLAAPAQAAYGTNTFTWYSNTGTPAYASMRSGPLQVGTTTSTNYVQILPNASIASNYSLTLPAAVPAAAAFVTVDTSGNLSFSPATSQGLTRAYLAAVGQQVSSSTGAFTSTSTSYTDVTNAVVSITTSGRPIVIFLINDGSGNTSNIYVAAGSTEARANFRINVTGSATTTVGEDQIGYNLAGAAGYALLPPGALHFFYPATSGTYTLQLQGKVVTGGLGFFVNYCKLVAYEL